MKELQSSTAEIGVSVHFKQYTPQSWALWKSGQKKANKRLVFAKRHVKESTNKWKRYSGQMRLKLSFLAIKDNFMFGTNPTPLITLRIPSPQ